MELDHVRKDEETEREHVHVRSEEVRERYPERIFYRLPHEVRAADLGRIETHMKKLPNKI